MSYATTSMCPAVGAILAAFGLTGQHVTELTVRIAVDEIIQVDVKRAANPNEVEKFALAIQDFGIAPMPVDSDPESTDSQTVPSSKVETPC